MFGHPKRNRANKKHHAKEKDKKKRYLIVYLDCRGIIQSGGMTSLLKALTSDEKNKCSVSFSPSRESGPTEKLSAFSGILTSIC